MRPLAAGIAFSLSLLGCSSEGTPGQDCAQDGSCPSPLKCFADFRCYPAEADAACDPPCYGALPHCDRATLRCAECVSDGDCPDAKVCSRPTLRCVDGCSAAHPSCGTDAQACDVDLGYCHGCLADRDCRDPARSRCDAETGRCAACVPDADNCPAGQYCAGGEGDFSCAPGCKDENDCIPPDAGAGRYQCCAHRCVDIAGDSNNCGGCGVACRNQRLCCAGRCSDVSSDTENCGGCGRTCYLPNVSGVTCVAQTCGWSMCESYFADCDHDASTGCEVNLTRDPRNCYGCGAVCAAPSHATAGCTVDGCGIGACAAGWADCDQNHANGCEYDTAGFLTDARNCGACGKACAGNERCAGGRCI